jgi:hypothetical protein
MPGIIPEQGGGNFAVEKNIAVGFSLGPILGVELEVDFFGGLKDDIWGKEAVQPPMETFDRNGGKGKEVGDLAQRMHPGIRPPGCGQADALPGHDLDFFFDDFLDGEAVGLNLPPVVIRTVILDDQLDIAHDRVSGFEFRVSSFGFKLETLNSKPET